MAKAGEVRVGGGFSLRHTGIPPLDLLPWGAHICLFYETEQDLIDANAAFSAPAWRAMNSASGPCPKCSAATRP
jgi:hypothetical protein